ncbi:hypothetical protein [Halobaculum sp. EA56]|uniref:hypothetical protein n=1 Tax=Halobaculum sp. EA56 TaxID=3421648 RepID=UPI003EBD7B86
MSLKQKLGTNENALDQVAGITGFGWTASALGYLGTVIGYSNTLVTNPQSLLYLGGTLFIATLGLDRLKDGRTSEGK